MVRMSAGSLAHGQVKVALSPRCPSPACQEDTDALCPLAPEGFPSPLHEDRKKRRAAPRELTVYQNKIAQAVYKFRDRAGKFTVTGMVEIDEELVRQQLTEGMKAYKGCVQRTEWRESPHGPVLDVVVSGTVQPAFDPTKNQEEKARKEQKKQEQKERRLRQRAEKELVGAQGAGEQGCDGQEEVACLVEALSGLEAGASDSASTGAEGKGRVLSDYTEKPGCQTHLCRDGPETEAMPEEQPDKMFSKRVTFCNPREDSETGEVVILIQRDLEHRGRVQGQ